MDDCLNTLQPDKWTPKLFICASVEEPCKLPQTSSAAKNGTLCDRSFRYSFASSGEMQLQNRLLLCQVFVYKTGLYMQYGMWVMRMRKLRELPHQDGVR